MDSNRLKILNVLKDLSEPSLPGYVSLISGFELPDTLTILDTLKWDSYVVEVAGTFAITAAGVSALDLEKTMEKEDDFLESDDSSNEVLIGSSIPKDTNQYTYLSDNEIQKIEERVRLSRKNNKNSGSYELNETPLEDYPIDILIGTLEEAKADETTVSTQDYSVTNQDSLVGYSTESRNVNNEPDTPMVLSDKDDLSSFSFSQRTSNVLKENGVLSASNLVKKSESFSSFKKGGSKFKDEVIAFLDTYAHDLDRQVGLSQLERLKDDSESTRYVFDEFGILCKAPYVESPAIIEMGGISQELSIIHDVSIKMLELPEAIIRRFRMNDLNTVGDVISRTDEQLLEYRGIGIGKIQKIRGAIDEFLKDEGLVISSQAVPLNADNSNIEKDPNLPSEIENALRGLETYLRQHSLPVRTKSLEILIALDDQGKPKSLNEINHDIENFKGGLSSNQNLVEYCARTLRQELDRRQQQASVDSVMPLPFGELWVQAALFLANLSPRYHYSTAKRTISYKYLTAEEWTHTLAESDRELIFARLSGKTLDETGKLFGVTRQRIRQKQGKILTTRPVLAEDQYLYLFDSYDLDLDDFLVATGADDQAFYYLKMISSAKEQNKKEISAAYSDPNLSRLIKMGIRFLLDKDYIYLDSQRIKKNKREIIEFILRSNGAYRYLTAPEIYSQYKKICNEYELDLDRESGNPMRAFRAYIGRSDEILEIPRTRQENLYRYYDPAAFSLEKVSQLLQTEEFQNKEISTQVFFDRPELQAIAASIDARNNIELFSLMRKFLDEEELNKLGIQLGRVPMLKIGDGNKHDQILEIIKDFGPIKDKEIAAEYERRYGVNQGTFIANYLKELKPYQVNGSYIYQDEEMSPEQLNGLRKILIQSEKKSPIISLEVLRLRFKNKFPDASVLLINDDNLSKLSYRVSERLVVKDNLDLREFFKNLISKLDRFEIEDEEFGIKVFQHSDFLAELNARLRSFDLLEYEPRHYLSTAMFSTADPVITKEDFVNYRNAVLEFAEPRKPFTLQSLRAQGFKHKLDLLETDYGFSPFALESVIETAYVGGRLKRTSVNENGVFCIGVPTFSSTDFLEYILNQHGALELYDLKKILKDLYGINTDEYYLRNIIDRSNLIYDEDTEWVFKDEEAQNSKTKEWINFLDR